MKAFLLAAGEGRRLRPLTERLPKCLVPIRGTPLLAIWLHLLEQHAITEVLINLHHAFEHVLDFLRLHRTALRIEPVHEPRLLGSAGTVLANRHFVEGESDFLIIYADNLTTVDLGRMVRFHRERRLPATIGVSVTDRPWEKGTVLVDDDGRVTEFVEKAPQPRSNLANAGIYVATPPMLDRLAAWRPGGGEAFDFGLHVLPRLVPDLCAYRIEEYLVDIGTPEAYEAVQASWPGLPGEPAAVR